MAKIKRGVQKTVITDNRDDSEDIAEHLDDLQNIARQQRRERAPEPIEKMPNGSTRMAKEIMLGDLKREAHERLTEAGICLREWLMSSDDADLWDRFQALTPGEKEALGKATVLRSLEATIQRRVREHGRKVEAERKANLKRVKYPSVSRRSFDDLGREPLSPSQGIVYEERTR